MLKIVNLFLVIVMRLFNVDLSMGKIPFSKNVPETHQKLIEIIDKKTFVTYEGSNGTYVTRVSCTKEDFFNDYVGRLHQNGYSNYAENSVGKNRFITLTKEETVVNCAYFDSTGVTSIISEPRGALCVREQDNTYTDRGIQTLLTGMKLCEDVATEGMGFVIRLCDGRFVIVDGGMGDREHIDSNKLMNILNEQKPADAEKPMIAAWIFTHLHGDHVGVFNCFSIDHHDEVEIQNFYYNFPSEAEMARSESSYMLDTGELRLHRYYQFVDCMNEYYPDVPRIKVHTGNRFYAANAAFEVLYAQEDMLPDNICSTNLNNSSIIFKMTVGGQTMFWTGDTDTVAIDAVMKNFGPYLKSDILQMPHHGMNGTVEFFSEINPSYAILPFHEKGYAQVSLMKQNIWLLASPELKQLIDTGRGMWTIPLPYEPEAGTYDRLPDESTVNPVYNGA